MIPEAGAARESAIARAHYRASRERKQMVVYFAEQDVYGRKDVWFVRPHDEPAPKNSEEAYRTEVPLCL